MNAATGRKEGRKEAGERSKRPLYCAHQPGKQAVLPPGSPGPPPPPTTPAAAEVGSAQGHKPLPRFFKIRERLLREIKPALA